MFVDKKYLNIFSLSLLLVFVFASPLMKIMQSTYFAFRSSIQLASWEIWSTNSASLPAVGKYKAMWMVTGDPGELKMIGRNEVVATG